jgi:hypothetical protein
MLGPTNKMGKRQMALDTTTFLLVFGATVAVLGLFIWFKFRAANSKAP